MSRDMRLHSLTARDTSTASAEPEATNEVTILVIRKERRTHHHGDADGVSEEGDEETDPRGITKRLYTMAESSLRGRRTLRVDST